MLETTHALASSTRKMLCSCGREREQFGYFNQKAGQRQSTAIRSLARAGPENSMSASGPQYAMPRKATTGAEGSRVQCWKKTWLETKFRRAARRLGLQCSCLPAQSCLTRFSPCVSQRGTAPRVARTPFRCQMHLLSREIPECRVRT